MNLVRQSFDEFYDLIKPAVFRLTAKDPEVAHEIFIRFCQSIYKVGIERFVLDNPCNKLSPGFEISNAAGFNKNGEIAPSVLKYFGFDRCVVGTVTGEKWDGNPRPRCVRYPKTESLVNWMGLPGIGAEQVAENLNDYRSSGVPLTINFVFSSLYCKF